MSRRQQAIGDHAEQLIQRLLKQRYHCVRKIETGWKVIKRGSRIIKAWPIRSVCGDFAAITSEGISVLVEVKKRAQTKRKDGSALPERLNWTSLEDHQHKALAEHAEHHGISLVAWVCDEGVCIFEYTKSLACGWRKGKSLQWEQAKECEA